MSDNTYKNLLFKFYGFDSDCKKAKNISSSTGITNFENITHSDEISEHLLSSEETGKNQNEGYESDEINDEKDDTTVTKSPHVLTVKDLLEEKKQDLQQPNLALDIINDSNDKSPATKNLTRLEDTFTKAIAKITDSPVKEIALDNSANLSSASVSKAKKLWRQKTMLTKENIITPANLLSKFNGVFLNLNNVGIIDFPIEILQHLKNIQMLYLDSNNLKEIPKELFIVLKKLKWLDVRNNHLTAIPPTVKDHGSLETFLLQGNSIEKLPLELGIVPNLKNLQTAYNPLVFPPQEVLDLDCSSIIHFLRKEWNKQHENEPIELKKVYSDEVEKKPSTIICYQPVEKNLQKKYKYHKLLPKSSVRTRTWNYKPNNRCDSPGLDFTSQQNMLWKNAAKRLLAKQATDLQKLMDKKVLRQWKCSYHTLKSRKVSSMFLKDPPFALYTESSQEQIYRGTKKQILEYKYNFTNLHERFKQAQKSLRTFEDTESINYLSPRSKQLEISSEIDKIHKLQQNINELKLCTHLIRPENSEGFL